MKRINILFFVQTLGMGGSERVVLDISRKLNPSVFKSYIGSFNDGPLRREFLDSGNEVFIYKKRARRDYLSWIQQISETIRQGNIDIVNTHHFCPLFYSFWGTKIRNNKILVHTDHSIWEIEELGSIWGRIGRYLKERSDAVIGVSENIAKYLKANLRKDTSKIHTIVNGIEIEKFNSIFDRQKMKRELGLKSDEKIIGCVGNLREEKNHENLLLAFNNLLKKINNLRLILVGDGEMKGYLMEISSKLSLNGKVLFLGTRSDVPQLMNIFDVYCLTSKHEGLPLTLLEAMSSKAPIVGTDVSGIRDVIKNGENGLLVKPNNPEKLAEAILQLLCNVESARRIAQAGYDYVLRNHNLHDKIKQYENLFETLYNRQ